MTIFNITNLVNLFGAIFSVNILTYTDKGFKPSRPKLVYCAFLLFYFLVGFYFGSKSVLPRREGFSMKYFSLWVMLSMQLFSPVLTLTMELLRFKKSASAANLIVTMHKLASSLGYRQTLELPKKHKIKSEIFIVLFCFTILLYLLFMLYPFDYIRIKNSLLLVQGSISVIFDIINRVYQTNCLRTMQLYSRFLKSTLKSETFLSLDKTAKLKKLGTVKAAHSLLTKTFTLFNSKYYVALLYTSLKTVVTVASIVSDFLVEKVFLSLVLVESDEGRSIEKSSYVDLVWSAYYVMFLLYTCHIHDSIAIEVNDMASVLHDVLTTEKVNDIADQLLDFSIEILHTDFHFSAYGFFKVDYTLMFRVLGNIVSYMVILVQFQFQTLSRLPSSNASLSSQLLAYANDSN